MIRDTVPGYDIIYHMISYTLVLVCDHQWTVKVLLDLDLDYGTVALALNTVALNAHGLFTVYSSTTGMI